MFAAIATPSGDPFTMTFMAVPMVVLFVISEVIARFNDRRRASRNINAGPRPRRGIAAVSDTECREVDAFDLPEWLGDRPGDVVRGRAAPARHRAGRAPQRYQRGRARRATCWRATSPTPCAVVDEQTRIQIHQAWRHGQVHVVRRAGRLTLGAPGTDFTAPRVLDVVGRLAKAVGAPPGHFAVRLRVARDGSGWDRGGG